ncbi:Dolichyl-diphosphooligosaccharide--protein glycosyltransferase subunit 1 [Escovopsis weberi]|uniref:Dolichyl-diphosphooligosaccharide--protein glycosyltransferase subunit 1 n=1 Tax=Escovopsis weberi TaxID=150374 RepID=A0A0M9VRR3_ESCWE|nr:Dolichyl-diphosphooligosaccharide--protein glycosyltransferase subunit 1 [Escovopsis weberi]
MKPLSVAAALLALLSPVIASAAQGHELPAHFKPPQVWQNTNLVHIISVERNYAKEQINILIENTSDEPQDEYFVPFTRDQVARLGAFTAKDRKDAHAEPFLTDAVEYDASSDVQYRRILLPSSLGAGAQQTISISYYYLKAYSPLPASINQDEHQYLVYDFSLYAPSAYPTRKQKTEVKSPSATVPDYTKVPGNDDVAEFPQKQGSKLIYGPFGEQPAGAALPAHVRFEFTKPVLHVSSLERDIEVSHWGGNIAFEERYALHHRGANLSSLFNRAKWAQAQYFKPPTAALKELRFAMHAGTVDPYFTDVVGNVSTSRFRSGKRETLLELRPRYPIFGGWKYPFTIGWNSDASHFLRSSDGQFVLKVPFIEGPRQPEGVEYGDVNIRVLLPEGSTNVKFHTDLPASAIVETQVGIHKTFLDTIGRTAVVTKAQNLVDELRDRELIISYELPLTATLRKPLVIFCSTLALYTAAWLVGKVELGFAASK